MHPHAEAVDAALGLSPRAAAGWRQVHARAVAAGFAVDAEAMAWRWARDAAGARSSTWLASAGAPEGHQATVKGLEVVEGLIRRTLGIKASPPTYRGIVADLGDFLVGWETTIAGSAIRFAARDLAELGETRPRDWKAKATRILDELERSILEDYDENIGETERTNYARFLAAAYKLGKAEVLEPMGWGVAFDLEDQDAIHGLTNSGLWWIGKAYGPQVPTATILAEVERVALRGGLGREAAGEALEAAIGSSFKRGPAYWRGLAATVATRSRSFGALSGLQAAGAVTYEYVNPLDERTSDVCRALDGVKFTIKGGIELRDRLLNAQDPEDWKAISPWPKSRDLVGPGGGLLTPAELQAKGIAWPPLHFHCRSSIDVDTWAPISAEDLGPPAVADPTAAKPPAKPRAPRARPGKPPPPPPNPYPGAVARWASAEDELKAMGAPLDRVGLPQALHTEIQAHTLNVRVQVGGNGPHVMGGIMRREAKPEAMTFRALQALVDELEGRAIYLHDGSPMIDAAKYADARLAGEVRKVLDTYTRRSLAYREAMELAPASVRATERRHHLGAMLRDLDKIKDPAQRAAVETEIDRALGLYDEHALAIMRWDGVTINHLPGESRAYAKGTWSLWESGGTYQDLTELVELDTTGPILPKYNPVRVSVNAPKRAPATVAHELGHVWDQVASGLGTTGARWRERADRPGLARLWEDGINAPFRAAIEVATKGKNKGKPIIQALPHESSKNSRYMFAGRWVRSYEARIYNGMGKPADDFLARSFRGEGGPVEFVSMAHQYVQEAHQGLEAAIRETRAPGAVEGLARWFRRAIDPTKANEWSGAPGANLVKARGLYGTAYRDALETMHGAGRRYLRDAGITRADFTGDQDLLGFAMAYRVTFGTPLSEIVGPGAPLAGFLSAPADVATLERIAAKLDTMDPDQVHAWLFDATSRKPPTGWDLTDPTEALDNL